MSDPKDKKSAEKPRALGRGLDALLPTAAAAAASRVDSEFQRVAIERVHPNKGQPRKHFDETSLAELAESIKAQGVIQPLVVRKTNEGYELVAGERRWRAAQRAGLHEVPVVIKDVSSVASFEMALVENLQRTDLDPIETAEAYQRLVQEHGYTQESLAERVGKSRAAVTNTLRLLSLPDEVRTKVVAGDLSEGHARALLTAKDPTEMVRLARESVEKKWSVRETEAAARKPAKVEKPAADAANEPAPATESPKPKSPNVRDLEKRLAGALGMSVVIRTDPTSKSGVVEIAFDSNEQLDGFLEKILGRSIQ